MWQNSHQFTKIKVPPQICSNYRPISCTAHIAKVMEKIMQEQLETYLYEHKFVTDDQSAYRPNQSTDTSIHKVMIDVLEEVNEGLVTGITLFDLARCFDDTDHDIL